MTPADPLLESQFLIDIQNGVDRKWMSSSDSSYHSLLKALWQKKNHTSNALL